MYRLPNADETCEWCGELAGRELGYDDEGHRERCDSCAADEREIARERRAAMAALLPAWVAAPPPAEFDLPYAVYRCERGRDHERVGPDFTTYADACAFAAACDTRRGAYRYRAQQEND
jgi:hypothetical protein